MVYGSSYIFEKKLYLFFISKDVSAQFAEYNLSILRLIFRLQVISFHKILNAVLRWKIWTPYAYCNCS